MFLQKLNLYKCVFYSQKGVTLPLYPETVRKYKHKYRKIKNNPTKTRIEPSTS